jgi:hypothetical protein
LPASLDADNPPPPPRIQPYKTHLAYVKERRTSGEAVSILSDALEELRARRAAGEVIY